MKVKWLLEGDTFDEGLDHIVKEIKDQGHEYKITSYIPFESGIYDQFSETDCVICYGSLNLMRHISRIKKWVPGPIMNLPNFECIKYYAHFGKYLMNYDYTMMPLAEMLRRKDELFEQYNGRFFVRPSTGFKSFTGQVVNSDNWDKDIEWIVEDGRIEEIVVISSVKKVGAEFRFIVADKKIITGCQYKVDGELDPVPWDRAASGEECYKFAQHIASEPWEPDRMYTVDIAGDYTHNISVNRLLEINSFSASGWYKCDPNIIVSKASEIALAEWKEAWK